MTNLTRNEQFLVEGGHAFPTVNTLVPKEVLETNVKDALSKVFGMDASKVPHAMIGNTLKPLLGDIDVAVSKEFVAKMLGVDLNDKGLYLALVNQIKKAIPGSDAKAFPGFQQVSFTKDLIDNTGKNMPAIDRDTQKIKQGEKATFQIDLMLGQMGYLDQIMSGAPQESKYKAVYRNLLIMSIFRSIEQQTKQVDPETKLPIWTKFDMTNKNGLRQMFYVKLPKDKRKVLSDKIVTTNPGEIASMLFKGVSSFGEINSFEKLWALVNSPKFKFPQKAAEAKANFLKNVAEEGLPIPENLQESA